MVIFFLYAIPKVTWSQPCWISCSTVTRNIDKSIFKDILQLKILRTWIKICASSFIKTLVNILRQKSTKVPWKLSLAKQVWPRTSKKIAPKYTISHLFLYAFFSFEQTYFLKANPIFIEILDSFCHSLFIFLPFPFWYSTDF